MGEGWTHGNVADGQDGDLRGEVVQVAISAGAGKGRLDELGQVRRRPDAARHGAGGWRRAKVSVVVDGRGGVDSVESTVDETPRSLV